MDTVLKIDIPPDRSKLMIHENFIVISGHRPVPNWWWRLWYWLLLGWKWQSLT